LEFNIIILAVFYIFFLKSRKKFPREKGKISNLAHDEESMWRDQSSSLDSVPFLLHGIGVLGAHETT
jgi:hypothetical protein